MWWADFGLCHEAVMIGGKNVLLVGEKWGEEKWEHEINDVVSVRK